MDYPVCSDVKDCKCQNNGVCDKKTGQCSCSVNFAGAKCEKCAPGFSGSSCMPSGGSYRGAAPVSTAASALRRDASAGGAAAGETAASAGATSNVKAGGATAKIADSDASLQPHHHMLLSIFELIALCMCCGCICRGGTCIRLLQKFRGTDDKLPSL